MDASRTDANSDWMESNKAYLVARVEEVRELLEAHAERASGDTAKAGKRKPAAEPKSPEKFEGEGSFALDTLCRAFDLTRFERSILLLCAGMELDAGFAPLCARCHENPGRDYPTFGLALAALPEPAWEALSPPANLRKARLVEVEQGAGLTAARLRIDERILHFLVGIEHRDEKLAGLVDPVPYSEELVASHEEIAGRLAAAWTETAGTSEFPVIQLCGEDPAGKRAVASSACARLDLGLHALAAEALPVEPSEIEQLIRLWERESMLNGSVLLVDCDRLPESDSVREGAVQRLVDRFDGPLIMTSQRRRRPRHRPILTLEVEKPNTQEQRDVWRGVLGSEADAMKDEVEALVHQFHLSAPSIRAAHAGALGRLGSAAESDAEEASPARYGRALWDACRLQARPKLDDLARRIRPAAGWDDLVMPDVPQQMLREIAAQVRQRGRVQDTWGFASASARGLGTSALFAGTSGTGKTMAAEVLAKELELDLYLIDLSAVVSKYIGETEKNLRRVFDAAEEGGAILLFDEADALFGKRSEVKDSHDRYANIEISYLLQRMESYRGLAILTSNLKEALDPAFVRRLRFVVDFPFPDAKAREHIWRRVFPQETPVEDLDPRKLARLGVAGGTIRNIALSAAYLAADANSAVTMEHLLQAARSEYLKMQKSLVDAEVRDWLT